MTRATPPSRRLEGGPCHRRVRIVWLPVAVMALLLAAVPLTATGPPKQATVLTPTLNLRSGPGLHHPPIARLRRGDRVLVLSYEGEWVRIHFNEQTGFVMNRERYLRIDEPDPDPAVDPVVRGHQTDLVNRRIEASEEKVASFSKEEAAILGALEETDIALDDARRKVVRLSGELEAVERQIRDLEGSYREMETRAAAAEAYVAERLAALYKLSWLGKFHVLASAASMHDFFARKHALEQILLHDDAVMTQLARDKAGMQTLMEQLVARKHEKQATTADLSAKIETMHAEQRKREALLSEVRGKKSLQLAAIEALKASSRELDRTVAAIGESAGRQPAPPSAVHEKPFAMLKGLLMMPVKGRIISFFGPFTDQTFKVTNFQSGITIQADRGEPIRAVYSGRTLFASWFKGFGNMLIIDHGDHYYSVYAHLEEQFKSKGDTVETGEVIATVGDTGSLTGAGLHFEIRYHGKPVDPLEWIKKG